MFYLCRVAIIVLAAAIPAVAAEPLPGPYAAKVLRVIDGDSFLARITIWLGQEAVTTVRLAGIDTAELHAPCLVARVQAAAARAFLSNRIEGRNVTLRAIAADKYGGRILAAAADEASNDLATLLAAAGLARPYRGRRADWCGAGAP